jgi:hypothetical protein
MDRSMTSTLLPPRGIFAVTSLVFDLGLPAAIKETLLQIQSLAWASSTHETPPLSYAQLSELTGKSHTTLHGHLDVLRTYHSALRLRSAGRGLFIVSLAGWLYPPRRSGALHYPKAPVNEQESKEEEESHYDSNSKSPPPDFNKGRRNSERSPATPSTLDPEVARALLEAGVFSFLLPEVSQAGWKEDDLLALMAWCQADNPERPGGLFMARLRAGAEVPERYHEKPCTECGRVGEHDPECRRRYISGPYAAFLEH